MKNSWLYTINKLGMFSMGINSEILLLMFKTDMHVNFKKVAMRDH